jgi:hypothetical protein
VNNEITPYVRGEVRTPHKDKHVVAKVRQIHEDVQEGVWKERGGFAIAGDIMDGLAALNNHRKQLQGDDDGLAMDLLDIQVQARNGAKKVLQQYYNDFGI